MGGRGSSGGSGGSGGGGGSSLPQLQGSEKQISWATDIRNAAYVYLKNIDKNIDLGAKRVDSTQPTTNKKDTKTVREYLNIGFNSEQAKSASWIIQNESNFSQRNIENMVRAESKKGQISESLKRMKKRK